MGNGHLNGDRTILAPPARAQVHMPSPNGAHNPPGEFPSLQEQNAFLMEKLMQAEQEMKRSHVAVRTMASVAVALARLLAEQDGQPLDRELVIPRADYDRMAGAEVGIRENSDHDVVVTIRDDKEHPIWEGRDG